MAPAALHPPTRARYGRSLRPGALALAAALLLVGAGCSSASARRAVAVHRPPVSSRPAPPEQFTGSVADFYRVPSPLRRGRPGQLIRVQAMSTTATAVTVRVMYHSRDARNRDRAVTGVISYPTAPAPHGGWPVVSWAHGTTGLASPCAPSRYQGAPGFGVMAVDVATDYIGLGPLGERHPYLSGPSEAHSVIDAVRAARDLRAAHAGRRWLALGHSQGGHSALFTNQLAASYAPELHLLGTVAFAPASVLARTFGPDDQEIPALVGLMALYGMQADHPQVHPRDYVSPQVAARDSVIDTGCLNDIIAAFVAIPPAQLYTHSPATTEPARSILLANDPGHVRSRSPLLVVNGTADVFVVPARVDALMEQLCSVHQVAQRLVVPGATHDNVVRLAGVQVTAWLQDRLAGKQAPDSCPAPH